LKVIFDLGTKKNRLEEIEGVIAKKDFWDNPEENKPILQERTIISGMIPFYKSGQ
jgi:hypothetical protein